MNGATLEQVKDVISAVNAKTNETIEAIKKEFDERDKAREEVIKNLQTELASKKKITSVKDMETDEDPNQGFKNFHTDFALSVYKMAKTPHEIDKRLDKIRKKAAGEGMEEGVDSEGGVLIPVGFRRELMSVGVEKSELMKRCLVVPIERSSVEIPYIKDTDRSSGYIHGAIMFYWTDEEGSRTKSKPALGKMLLKLHKLAGLTYSSDEIMEDSPITIGPMLDQMFTDGLAWVIDDVVLNGNGSGQPLGALNSNCAISVSGETGQLADTIVWQNIIKMYARATASAKKNGVWVANHDTLPQLLQMSLAVGTGGSALFVPQGGGSVAPYNTLLGKPIIFNEHSPSIGDAADIAFIDFSQYLLGLKSGANNGMKTDISAHFKFDTDEMTFKFTIRIAGQCWWPAALTPHKGSSLSPIVTLASR
ncbi:MAG: phage major capsid protein [Candidatus Thorarchaeota archaeon]